MSKKKKEIEEWNDFVIIKKTKKKQWQWQLLFQYKVVVKINIVSIAMI
jgi:hypothetical protein